MTDRAIRRMPVICIVVQLDGDYEGWEARMRVNPPHRIIEHIQLGDLKALNDLVVDWNFVDESGEPLPLPKDGGIGGCPDEVILRLLQKWSDATKARVALPNTSSAA